MDGNDRAVTTGSSQHSTSSADNRAVAALIARLLLHYWTPQDLSDGARAAMAQDWLDDLREFGPEIVSEACGRWRRGESRRPTIADIRQFALEAREERREPAVMMLPAPERDRRMAERARREAEMAAEGRELTNAWARAAGYESFDAYLEGGGTYGDALPQILAWSQHNPAAASAA